MWIYQEASNTLAEPRPLPLPGSVNESLSEDAKPQPLAVSCREIPEKRPLPAEPLRAAELPPKKPFSASKDCILLAGSYLFGTFLAGILQALCDGAELDTLSYYKTCWQSLFAATDPAHLPQLFGAEVGTIFGALSVLFFLGLSAIGPVMIFLFMMLYGAGSGLLFSQLTAGMSAKTFLLFAGAAGIPAAAAAGGLCLFGTSALQVSSRIQAFSFGRKDGIPPRAGAGLLAGQFAVTATAFLPLCGAATGLAYLACRIVSH